MLPYQSQTVDAFMRLLPPDTRDILEIGSDIGGEVVSALAQRKGVRVVGLNPSPEFPKLAGPKVRGTFFFKADGRFLPFPDNSFDAVLSVATMEHVNGLDLFMTEIARVLRPKGVFYTDFSPIWSCAIGHHVYAVVGSKEARFWKPGKNPIPDYAHLLWSPEEMRAYLSSGPCSEELIEPILQWIYHGDSINRCHFEEYMDAFRKSPLVIQRLQLVNSHPDSGILSELFAKYGSGRNFSCLSISAVFRKLPGGRQRVIYKALWGMRRQLGPLVSTLIKRLRNAMRAVLFLAMSSLGLSYAFLTKKTTGA